MQYQYIIRFFTAIEVQEVSGMRHKDYKIELPDDTFTIECNKDKLFSDQ